MNKELKGLIISKFGTQFEFAQVVRTHESMISKVIRGRRSLSPKDQETWIKALGCDPELLGKDICASS